MEGFAESVRARRAIEATDNRQQARGESVCKKKGCVSRTSAVYMTSAGVSNAKTCVLYGVRKYKIYSSKESSRVPPRTATKYIPDRVPHNAEWPRMCSQSNRLMIEKKPSYVGHIT